MAQTVALAERVRLPAVRRDRSATAVADRFGCREQLRQLAQIRGRHLAELLATAPPARAEPPDPAPRTVVVVTGGTAGAVLAGAIAGAMRVLRRRQSL